MGDAYAIVVCNWDKWQTYRTDRGQPPWIKLHRRLLRNAEWISLTDVQRGQLVAIWMLAADNNGVIATPTWRQGGVKAASRLIRKLCHMDSEPDLELFKQLGFITYDANVTPERRQDDANVTPQNRVEENRVEENFISETSTASAVSPLPTYLTFPCDGKVKEWHLTKTELDDWYKLYGHRLDVLTECKAALGWIQAKPERRKTARGMKKFLVGWFNREIDRGANRSISKEQAKAEAEQQRRAYEARKRGNGKPTSISDVSKEMLDASK